MSDQGSPPPKETPTPGGFAIPNLKSLGTKSGPSRRRRPGPDAAVQETNDDACVSKMSAIRLGYYKDPFVQYFCKRGDRRSPLINRGYFARFTIIDNVIKKFLSLTEGRRRNFVSIGAGFDTIYLRLKKDNIDINRFLELDFQEVTARKVETINGNNELLSLIDPKDGSLKIAADQGSISSSCYCLSPCDLRKIDTFQSALSKAGLEREDPVLFISECVLIYVDSADSSLVLKHIADSFSDAAFLSYEQIRPDDAFGKQMLKNLEQRGCPLRGIHDHPDTKSQEDRLKKLGWGRAESLDMKAVYEQCLQPSEIARISRLEVFDEFEEWGLIMSHYALTVGTVSTDGPISSLATLDKHGATIPSFNKFIS